MKRPMYLTDEEVERIVELYGQGASILQVGEMVNRSGTAVRMALMRAGVERRRPSRRSRAEEIAAKELVATSGDLAFDGDWVRVGMVWKPRPRESA